MKKTVNIVLLLLIAVVAVIFFVLDPNSYTIFPKCIFHSITGAYCPGCGSQRALHSLLHLDLGGVVRYNALFLPATLLLIYHYTFKWINRVLNLNLPNLFYLKYSPWVIFAVIVLFWILRNLPWVPFSLLAPA
jgi:hypothetical protein